MCVRQALLGGEAIGPEDGFVGVRGRELVDGAAAGAGVGLAGSLELDEGERDAGADADDRVLVGGVARLTPTTGCDVSFVLDS